MVYSLFNVLHIETKYQTLKIGNIKIYNYKKETKEKENKKVRLK